MFKEPDILNGDDRMPKPFWNSRQRGLDTTLNEKLTDALLVARIDLRDQARLIGLQLIQWGKVIREVPHETADG